MTYYELILDAVHKLNSNQITIREYEEMIEPLKREIEQPCEDCRNCKRWDECPCGKEGHKNGTSIGYSIGECKDYEPSLTPKHSNWIPIKWHEITEEEREREGYPEEWGIIYDCRLPDEGTVTLIQTKWGIDIAPFCEDESGSYWEQYETPGEVIAWQPLPESYEEGSGGE